MTYDVKDIRPFIELLDLNEDGYFTDNDAEDYVYSLDRNKVPDFDYEYGATKLVIIPKNKDYVIKIPFNGGYSCGEYTSFNGANDEAWGDNYCEAEVEIYQLAKEAGFEKMFLPLTYVLTSCVDIYIQPKCECYIKNDVKQDSYSSKESKERILEDKKQGKRYLFGEFSDSWTASCLDVLGSIEELKRFEKFLEDNGIFYDLHSGNIGYYEGHAVILDYGGYNEYQEGEDSDVSC